MLPLHNPFPHLSYQVQSSTQFPQQVMAPQSQLGLNNSQVPIPFSNSSMPNVPTSMAPPPGFMNGPNNFYPLQNNHLGTPHLGNLNGPVPQPGKPHLGFGPQSSVNNINSIATFPIHGQGFGHSNLSNLPQFNQNVGLTFGQICMPNHLQSTNQYLPMQMQNLSQFVPQNAFGVLSQALQPTVPQNPAFLANPQFGTIQYNQIQQLINHNQHNFPLPGMDVSTLKPSPIASRQLQGNSSTIIQTEQTNILQPPGFMGTQGNYTSNGKNPSSKNFTRNAKRGMPQGGFQNSQFRHTKHGNKKFGFSNAHNGRGPSNEKSGRFACGTSLNKGREQRRSLSLTYTEQEILKWREERRKNYPSKGNVEKKLAERQQDKQILEREAEIRREQLKEILAKQAELGVEVAEIPGCYLSDPKQQGQGREENGSPLNKKGRLHKKFDKRGRYDKKDRYSKKQRLNDNPSSDVPLVSKRKPSLLEKLLSADITRDKSHLLQAFRFMVMNSFFKDGPDKPLTFPSVIVKEGSGEDGVVEQSFPHAGKGVSEVSDETVVGKTGENDDIDDDNDGGGGGDSSEDDGDEEEGEIIN